MTPSHPDALLRTALSQSFVAHGPHPVAFLPRHPVRATWDESRGGAAAVSPGHDKPEWSNPEPQSEKTLISASVRSRRWTRQPGSCYPDAPSVRWRHTSTCVNSPPVASFPTSFQTDHIGAGIEGVRGARHGLHCDPRALPRAG